MSYRSIKRVLGETSLERKCRFLFGACLLLLITGSFWWYGQQTERLVYRQNRIKNRLTVDTIMVQTHWTKDETNPYYQEWVPRIGSQLRNHKYAWTFLFKPEVAQKLDFKQELTDPFELELLDRFQKQPAAAVDEGEEAIAFAERLVDGGQRYEYFQPVFAKSFCLQCHGTMRNIDLAEGDLIAIAKVTSDNKPTQRDLNWNRAVLLATAIITVALAMIASYVIVRYVIVKPLKHLRDVSDAVSHGHIDQRAEIHTADEFEDLGVAFNRMLRHLVAAQQELRQVNADLDGKVDQLAQANMQLFELNRLKSDFLATMSHELRTPLNSIIGFSDVLGSINSLDDKQKRYVQNIQKSGKVLLDMINDILDLAKIESGKMEVRPSDFRIEHLVAAQCDMARPLSERKNIDLDAEIALNLPALHQDQGKVQQILNNLLSNAIKFTPEGGRVTVSARRNAAGDLLLIVADTGVGIAEEDQTAIFEKFRQGQSVLPGGDAMTREYSGTGLGLSIVKELCKLLGGEVSLESELGKGSTFVVRLPWSLAETSRVESPLAASLDEMARPTRLEFERPVASR